MAQPLIAHIEIPTTNLEKSKDFFAQLFEWEFKPFGRGYLLFNTHQGITVGLKQVDKISNGNTTIFHVLVDEIEDVIKKAKELNGELVRGKTVIPAFGWYALISDNEGNTIGLYQKPGK